MPSSMPRAVALLLVLAVLAVASPSHAALDPTHQAWTALLEKYNHDGVVDYARWKADGVGPLQAYLHQLEAVTPDEYEGWDPPTRLAFWFNTYNAYMIHIVLDAYPIAGVKDLGSLIDPYKVFKREAIPFEKLRGAALSLNDVEHEILRKEFREPRIHFAIVCASKSCPVLNGEAFRGPDLEAQLSEATRRFLADDFRNRADPEAHTLYLSHIFDWFGEDFVRAAGSVRAFVARAAGEATMRAVASDPESSIEFLDYDWSLNGA